MSEPKTIWVGKDFGKEGKYKCKHCGARFVKPQSLGAHVTAHHTKNEEVLEYVMAGRKRFKEDGELCPWGCGERFYSPRKLVGHILSVHKDQVEKRIQEMKEKGAMP